MKTIIDRFGIAAAALVLLLACSSRDKTDVLAEDTTLTRDLALANQDTTPKPQLQDVPLEAAPPLRVPAPRAIRTIVRRPPPAVRKPSPLPAAEPPATSVTQSGNTEKVVEKGSEHALGVVSAGIEISLTAGQQVCTNTNSVGDRITAQIASPVMGANGAVIPVGATAIVSITSLHRSTKSRENIELGLRVESISYAGTTYPVSSETTYAQIDRVRASNGNAARKVATGAAIGAVLGQILGHKTNSTIIGAGAGAAAGAVMANRDADYDGCIPVDGRITIRLTEPLTIQAE